VTNASRNDIQIISDSESENVVLKTTSNEFIQFITQEYYDMTNRSSKCFDVALPTAFRWQIENDIKCLCSSKPGNTNLHICTFDVAIKEY